MTNRLTLTNAGQNSGNALILLGASFSYQWTNMTNEFPISGKYTGIIETNFKGWQNPVMNVSFYIETDSPTVGSITWTQWNNIVKDSVNHTYLNLKYGTSDTSLISFASVAAGSTGTSSINIQIKDYQLQVDPNKINRLYITFNCIETK